MDLRYISPASSQTDFGRTHSTTGADNLKSLAVISSNSATQSANLTGQLANVSVSDVGEPSVAIRVNE
eukprot:CAMPEP_0206321102 /NCGR_PEP_ID=MMETSP0106_2-20121207/18691_1 /ASSEMBLY_ACC=CAM_ASM_000206 /TAXON_ID=81532 /ORGANISM="Acanthoeca-like sp., Strain 10tr" /LENGTH=67 /DNA_ID=CAMNT_0053753141 /DNA_START=71 /DNA_END=271 /DNA_ORIENTATION=+